jgi:aspartate carbamoyltransferase regulatory subunit
VILALNVFPSCNAEKRLNRLVKNNPELVTIDTVKIVDTVIIPSYSIDTVTRIEFHDTVNVINNERVLLKYFYDTLRQEIWHEVECKEDTIIHTIPVPVERIKAVTSNKIPFYYWLLLVALVALTLYAVFKLLRRA